MEKLHPKRNIWAWALYDWANSGFTTIILTFVFGAYFAQSVAPTPAQGLSWWSYALTISGLGLAVLGPLCGAVADRIGYLKRWTAGMAAIAMVATLVMGLAVPQSSMTIILVTLAALIIANIGFELSLVFNNAMLPQVAPPAKMGQVSSLAWGLGYLGGLVCLVFVLFGLVGLGEAPPWIPLPRDEAEYIRAGVIVVFIWYLLFSLPLFLLVREEKVARSQGHVLKEGIASLKQSLQALRTDKPWRNFLIGSAIYRDGLTTLFSLGGGYAAARYGMTIPEILVFGIGMNVTAGIGCLVAAFIEDKVGSLRMIRVSLIALILIGGVVVWAPDKTEFYASALMLGFFIGPVQSASRTMVARIAPQGKITESYGLYALSGRAVAFLGPFAFGLATSFTGSMAVGMATIIGFWIAGWLLIRTLKVDNNRA